MQHTFEYENEVAFLLTREKYLSLFTNSIGIPPVHCFRCVNISQIWFNEMTVNNIVCRSRIRMWEEMNTNGDHPISDVSFEYTTKYYFEKSRIEINSPLEKGEYLLLTNIVHKNLEHENKKRFFLMDTKTGLVYTADISDDKSKPIRIEIEFKNEEDRNNYVIPEWLKNVIGGVHE